MEFETWKNKVENYVYIKINIKLKDLPDEDFWVNWYDSMSYKEMGNKIINNYFNFGNFIIGSVTENNIKN